MRPCVQMRAAGAVFTILLCGNLWFETLGGEFCLPCWIGAVVARRLRGENEFPASSLVGGEEMGESVDD